MKSGSFWAACTLAATCALSACKPTDELAACNVAEESCQLDIYYALLRLRGDGVDPFGGVPPIRTLTIAEYERELNGGKDPEPEDEEPADGGAQPPPEAKPPKVNPWDVTLQLLGMIPPKVTTSEQGKRDRIRHVAAYYSSATRTVTVIVRPEDERNDFYDTLLLTHELVHAVQDDEIGSFDEVSTDADNVRRAMIEGEATLYEHLTNLALLGRERDAVQWKETYQKGIKRQRRGMINEGSSYHATNWFLYSLGAGRLIDGYLEGGNAAVRHILANPPRSSSELMLYLDEEENGQRARLACRVAAPGSGYALAGYDEFGALQIYGFLVKAGVPEEEAWASASHVTDDRLWVYFDEQAGSVAVSWRQRFGDRKDAGKVADAMAADRKFTVTADGGDLLIRASNREGLLDEWPGAGDCNR